MTKIPLTEFEGLMMFVLLLEWKGASKEDINKNMEAVKEDYNNFVEWALSQGYMFNEM